MASSNIEPLELNGEIELIFDASLAFERLDSCCDKLQLHRPKTRRISWKDLVETFQQELGRLLTPFEIEDLSKTVKEEELRRI